MEVDHGTRFSHLTLTTCKSFNDSSINSPFCNVEEAVANLANSSSPTLSECTDMDNSSVDSSFDADNSFACAVNSEYSLDSGKVVYDATSFGSMASFADYRVQCGIEPGSFLVTNLASVVAQYQQWVTELPMVEPFYAVKCNPDTAIVRTLAGLGCGFDCATMGEIDIVVNGLGEEFSFGGYKDKVAQSIVYANPAKMESHLNFAIKSGVRMTVFDGEDELYKIARLRGHDQLELLLRLTTDDKDSVCRFSKKFGCPVAESPKLLDLAKQLGLNVIGVSFHVGSGCGDAGAYTTALNDALEVFAYGEKIGMNPMTVIDIGGGFPGDTGGYGGPGMPTFQNLAQTIRSGIVHFNENLPSPRKVRFIAEPGRYFVSAAVTIVTKVYARKGGISNVQALYCDDGVYGSFNNVVYDHAHPVPRKLSHLVRELQGFENTANEEQLPTAVFGPTCDGLDQMCSMETTSLPRCETGDWLIFENMGAYTHTASFIFNGYSHFPNKVHCIV